MPSAAALNNRAAPPSAGPRAEPDVAARSAALIAAPVGIFETDSSGACTSVNARWSEYAGMAPQEALGQGWLRAIHPDDRERVAAAWHALVTDNVEFAPEFRFLRPDGRETWVSGRAGAIRSDDGEIAGYVGTLTDTTVAVETRRQLTIENQFIDTILELAGSLVCVLEPDGRFIRFNRACEMLSGYSSEEVADRPFYDFLIPKAEIPAVRESLGLLVPGEPPVRAENHWVTRDGSLRLISWANAAFLDADGIRTHIVGTGTDITEQRRTQDALLGVEAVGRLLAKTGPTDDSMSAVLAELAGRMGYGHIAVFLREGERLRLAAQLGYDSLPVEFEVDRGIAGRVTRTAESAFVSDVSSDPDYVEGDPSVTSEIVVPLVAAGITLGVLSIASTAEAPLFAADLQLAETVAERLSVAIQLGREQQVVSDRARLLAGVSGFARRTNGILDTERLSSELLDAIAEVMHFDTMGLSLVDRATGRYTIHEIRGAIDPRAIGSEVHLGDGAAGNAIASKALFVAALSREDYSGSMRDLLLPGALFVAGVPLIRDGVVLGAVSVGRRQDTSAGFSDMECEVLTLLAAHAALALVNAELVQEVRELSIRDTLTGLYNRRHFDTTLEQVFARWRRAKTKQPLSAIFFDLDHFGRFNNEHGHQAGDAVLRAFAGILQERFRAADLVARFGGEEFIAILEETDLDGARTVAEDVRATLADHPITGPDDQVLRATVSGGCSTLDPAEPTPEALLRTADVALYMAKRAGRNQIVCA